MPLNTVFKNFHKNPQKLFLLDGVGALVSAFLLGVVLVNFQQLVGIPVNALYLLAVFPVLFAVVDLICCLGSKHKFGLKIVSSLNLLYCVLSLIVALFHFSEITVFGWGYIIAEIMIVFFLALLEMKVANNIEPI